MISVKYLVSRCYSDQDYSKLIADSCHRYILGEITDKELAIIQLAIQKQIQSQ
jgi:hypothetical protein